MRSSSTPRTPKRKRRFNRRLHTIHTHSSLSLYLLSICSKTCAPSPRPSYELLAGFEPVFGLPAPPLHVAKRAAATSSTVTRDREAGGSQSVDPKTRTFTHCTPSFWPARYHNRDGRSQKAQKETKRRKDEKKRLYLPRQGQGAAYIVISPAAFQRPGVVQAAGGFLLRFVPSDIAFPLYPFQISPLSHHFPDWAPSPSFPSDGSKTLGLLTLSFEVAELFHAPRTPLLRPFPHTPPSPQSTG